MFLELESSIFTVAEILVNLKDVGKYKKKPKFFTQAYLKIDSWSLAKNDITFFSFEK